MSRLIWAVLFGCLVLSPTHADSGLRKRVQVLLKQADSKDKQVREKAIKDLVQLGPRTLPYVLPALQHKRPRVRLGAVRVICASGKSAASLVPQLVGQMADKDLLVREAIQGGCEKIGMPHPKVLGALNKLTTHKDYNVRMEAVKALGRYGKYGGNAAGALVERLGEKDRPQVRSAAKKALVAIGSRALSALGRGARSSNPSVRGGSITVMVEIGKPVSKITPALSKCLRDPDSGVKLAAIRGLGRLGQISSRLISPLQDALRDRSSTVRIEAASALGQLGAASARAVGVLRLLLEDEDASVRSAAANCLGRIGPAAAPAAGALALRLGDERDKVRQRVGEALSKIGPPAEPILVRMLAHKDPVARRGAMEALAGFQSLSETSIPSLIRGLSDPDPTVRRLTVKVLARGGEAAMNALVQALEEDDVMLRRAVVRVLGSMGELAEDAVPSLSRQLIQPDYDLREEAKKSLRRIRSATKRTEVRQEIDRALESVGG